MSFPRVNIGGWSVNAVLTSAQQNQLDIDHANALDGLNGGTYTLASKLVLDGVGGFQVNKTFWNIRSITSNYTIDASQFDFAILADTTASALSVTLTAAVAGRVVIVKHYTGANTLGVVPNGTNTIDGINANLSLNQIGSGVVLLGISSTAWVTVAKV